MAFSLRPSAHCHVMALASGDQERRAGRSGQADRAFLTRAHLSPCLARAASSAQSEGGGDLERPLQPDDRELTLSTCRATGRAPSERTTR